MWDTNGKKKVCSRSRGGLDAYRNIGIIKNCNCIKSVKILGLRFVHSPLGVFRLEINLKIVFL